MPESTSDSSLHLGDLILVPALITLGVTFLRLGGELAHWSPRFFGTSPGGGLAIVGITWLPILLGPYFAIKLTKSGHGASGVWKTFGLALLGIVIMIAGGVVGFGPHPKPPGREVLGILLMLLGPSLVTLGWPALFRALVAYGYAARIPVAIIMFFALRGHWGTHYDALPPGYSGPTSFFGKYMMVAFLPQMVLWPAYTVAIGALFGSIVTGLVYRGKTPPATA
jgi:hypothetical protein